MSNSDPFKEVTRAPPPTQDASRVLPKGPSVNADSTRSGTAPTPGTLGPREA
jgi:hypothetical protein